MTPESASETAPMVDDGLSPRRHHGRFAGDPRLVTRLNEMARCHPGALVGALDFWVGPCDESQFDVKN